MSRQKTVLNYTHTPLSLWREGCVYSGYELVGDWFDCVSQQPILVVTRR